MQEEAKSHGNTEMLRVDRVVMMCKSVWVVLLGIAFSKYLPILLLPSFYSIPVRHCH